MTLAPNQYKRLQYLLGKQQSATPLTPAEREEVRHLLAVENPDVQRFEWEKLVEFGLILLGAHVLFRAFSE